MGRYKKNFRFKLDYQEKLNSINAESIYRSFQEVYNGNIIYNLYKSDIIQIQIFYSSDDLLYDKMLYLQENNINLIDGISIYEPQNIHPPTNINLSESRLIGLKDDDCIWENGFRYIILEIDRIKMLDKYTSGDENYAVITLHENALAPIHSKYNYNIFDYDYPNKFEAVNNEDFIHFGSIMFRLEFDFQPTYFYKDKIKIKFVPKIKIRKPFYSSTELSHNDIINHIDAISILLSFYYNREIDFFHCIINEPNNVLTFVKHIDLPSNFTKPIDFNDDLITLNSFINESNYNNVHKYLEVITNIVSKLIFSSRLDTISEFMILYNIIEIIRNHYLTKKIISNVKENYKFKHKDSQVTNTIRTKLSEIAEMINDDQKDHFKTSIENIIGFLKRKNIGNQFNSLFEYLKIDTKNTYKLDFNKIINFRNKVYHGSIKLTEENKIIEINIKLRKLIKDLTRLILT